MIGFYPGSFDPVTRGHIDIVQRALVFCPQLVIGVGRNMHKKSLFAANERMALVQSSLQESFDAATLARIRVDTFDGATVDYATKIGAKVLIKGLRGAADYAYEEKMAIVNQRLAPHLESVFLFTENELRDVSSSVVKEMAMAGVPADKFDHYLTATVRDTLLQRLHRDL